MGRPRWTTAPALAEAPAGWAAAGGSTGALYTGRGPVWGITTRRGGGGAGGAAASGSEDASTATGWASAPSITGVALAATAASPVTPGLYRDPSSHLIYLGLDEEPPDRIINYFDPLTGMDGAISDFNALHLEKLKPLLETLLAIHAAVR